MRVSKGVLFLVLLSFVAVAASISFAGAKAGQAWLWPDKQGEICLEIYNGTELDGTVYMYVKKMGDDHYLVLGRNVEEDGTTPFIGAAEIVTVEGETKVRIHATASGTTSGSVHGTMATMFLDPVHLTGILTSIDMKRELHAIPDRSHRRVFRCEVGKSLSVTGIFRFLKPGGPSCCLESGNRRLDVRGFPKALPEYQARTMSCRVYRRPAQ
jgi:hypothetical protein